MNLILSVTNPNPVCLLYLIQYWTVMFSQANWTGISTWPTATVIFPRPSQLFNCHSIVKNAQLTTALYTFTFYHPLPPSIVSAPPPLSL